MAGFFDTLFGGGAQEDAAAKNAAALGTYQTGANQALQTGYDTGVGNLNSAIGAYSPLAALGSQYSQAGTMLGNALGTNGAAGTQAAQAAFQNAPGYSGAIDAGLSAIDRQRASMGMANSGNANLDAQTFGQNLQNQQYNTWLQNLSGLSGQGLTATSGAAQGQGTGYTNLANLAQTNASNQAGVLGNVTSGTMADNNMVAAGQAAGAKNLLGAGLSLATLAATGGMSGLGGMLGGAALGAAGNEFGGSAAQPLPGLSASDYGTGTNAGGLFASYGVQPSGYGFG